MKPATTVRPESAEPPNRLTISVRDMCQVSGLSRSTVAELIASGELPSLKVGRRRLIRVTDAEKFIADRVIGGDAA